MSKRKYNDKKISKSKNKLNNLNSHLLSKKSQTAFHQYSKCGEIFLSLDDELLLNCNFCDISVKVLEVFWDHLLEKHLCDIKKIKSEIQLNEFSKKNNNSDIVSDRIKYNFECNKNVISDNDDSCSDNDNHLTEQECNPTEYIKHEEKSLYDEIKINKHDNKNLLDNILKNKNNDCKYQEQHTPKGYWQCDICHLVLKRGQERKLHEKTHKGVKRLICETCGKGYTSKNRLLDHIRTHTGEKPFKCRFCPKAFFSHSSMKSHDKTHIGFKPFKCGYCDHNFKTKLNKQIHEKKHHNKNKIETEPNPNSNVCKLCSKTFKCADYLVLHLKRHEEKLSKTSPKPFECSFCPSTFISNVNKNAHERLYHKGEYNYKCDFCGKGFLKLNKKRQHEEMHTRIENPYKCDLCECEYARPEGLKKHKIAKHTNDSLYKCQICQAGFESIILFIEHCKQHNVEEKLHGCSYCEARFDTQIRLNRHIDKMHHMVQEPNDEINDKSES